MNRRKKVNNILKKRAKKANAKRHPSQKPKYISKAERARLAAEVDQVEQDTLTEPVNDNL